MDLPFGITEFFDVFEVYNRAIWPAQIVAYLLGLLAFGLTLVRRRGLGILVSSILALFWTWTGIVYHMSFFSAINTAAMAFGAAFLLQGVLFMLSAAREGLDFSPRIDAYTVVGTLFVLYAMVGYPLVGMATGDAYPRAPMFGVTPCPLTIFTFGIFLLARPRVGLYILVIPFLWSLLGSTAAFTLGIYQDYGLLVAGVVGLGMLLFRRIQHRGERGDSATSIGPPPDMGEPV